MQKLWMIAAVVVALGGCDTGTDDETNIDNEADIQEFSVSGTSGTVSVSHDAPFALYSSGVSNNITVAANSEVIELIDSGSGNMITLGEGVTIESCTLAGVSATVYTPDDLYCTDDGVGNSVIVTQN